SIVGDVIQYYPNVGFSGMDYLSYRSGNGTIRNDAINVLSADTELSWRPTAPYCVSSGGTRTGFVAYSTLSEYDNILQSFTGNVKPNVDTDSDYVAPHEDLDACPIGLEYTRIGVLS